MGEGKFMKLDLTEEFIIWNRGCDPGSYGPYNAFKAGYLLATARNQAQKGKKIVWRSNAGARKQRGLKLIRDKSATGL